MLGICRGMELLNVARGGTLDQHLADARPPPAHPGRVLRPRRRPRPGLAGARVVGAERLSVRSHHHQGIDRLGDGVVASGWAEPGEHRRGDRDPGAPLGRGRALARRGGRASPVLAALTAAAREQEQVARRDRGRRAGDRAGDGRGAARRHRGDRRRGRGGQGGVPGLARGGAGRTRGAAARARRRPRVEPRRAGDARGAQRRQADLRRPRRDRDGGRDLPLLRRRAGAPARQDDPGGRRGRRHLPRAARRRRPDHALELPAGDRLLEGGAGARGRQHRRAQAGRADPADGAGDGADRRSRQGSPTAS